MTVDPPPPGPTGDERAGSGLGRVLGRLRRPGPQGPAERMRILTVGGRGIRVSVRPGAADWPPLLLCNGIGVSLELFQPFVDALDPRRPVIRFDMPGIGGSPTPVVPYHLAMLPSLHLAGHPRTRAQPGLLSPPGCEIVAEVVTVPEFRHDRL